ncbi:MAG: DUF924 family protein [Alphaproteobacteria bacterium]
MDAGILGDAHRFWFGELAGPQHYPTEKSETWFKRSDGFDAAIHAQFGDALEPVHTAAWDLEALTREQQIGLVIMLDQFPRNLFRDSGQAFAYDPQARAIAGALTDAGPARFYSVERSFLFMPFMHAEDIRDQETCVALIVHEALNSEGETQERSRGMLDFAFWHRSLIRKFGRFPHRNAVLGRESTEDEAKHLAEKGRGY